jgi:hypothetical protein
LYIVGVKRRKREKKSRKMRKIQKEVGRWICGRQIVEGYNMQQNLERGMIELEDTARQKK